MTVTSTPTLPEDALTQLRIIGEIDAILRPVGIQFWLRGGWAIDFLLGHFTRPHSDIDLMIRDKDVSRLRQLMKQASFTTEHILPIQDNFYKYGQEISVVFIAENDNDLYVEGIPDWIWLSSALSYPIQTIDDLSAHVLSPEQLFEEKAGYYRGTGRPLRPKDRHSMAILRQIISP